MGADGGMPGSANRANALSSSDVHPLPQCLQLDQISWGTQKFLRSGELRRALGFPSASASEDLMFRASNFKPAAPVATEDVKLYKANVLNASIKARERLKLFRSSIIKLDKYTESIGSGSKKRQRPDTLSNEKAGGSNLLKMTAQPSRYLLDQSTQLSEDRTNCSGINKRFRSSVTELRVDGKFSSLSRDQMSNVKDTNITSSVSGESAQPEERIPKLPAVGEGWAKNKQKRVPRTIASRSTDNGTKKPMQIKLNPNTKLASCDTSAASKTSSRSNAKQETSSGSPGTNTKGKNSRGPRTGSLVSVSYSDGQAFSQSCEGWEHSSSANNKVISLGLVQNNNRTANSSQTLGPWGGQRQQKGSRPRRTNVISPVTNHDEGQNLGPPVIEVKSLLTGNSGTFDSVDVRNINSTPYTKVEVESTPSPGRLSEVEEILGLEHGVEEKGSDVSDVALKGKGKVGAFVFPTKRIKNISNENGVDDMRKQGRTIKGVSLSGVPQSEAKLENMPTFKRIQQKRHGCEKIKGKSGRPPARKMSDGRVTRNLDSEDDHEELLAAATAARKASCLSCSGRFWKKIEPVFSTVSDQDKCHLKQQLSLAEELEDSQSLVSCDDNNFLGVLMHKDTIDVPSSRKRSDSNQVVDKNESVNIGFTGERNLDNFNSLYQRVLCALIEEDDNDGFCNVYEGACVSFQCASDDSHCGSCNYADTETRYRDRFESEAESVVDIQIPKRHSGDRFSCNKSVASNTTWTTSMSDSLYSSGRWLGDDGLSYSDAEFIGGSYQHDVGGPQGLTASVSGFDCQYELLCVDDKLAMELQSIGLYPDAMPDLAEGEVIDQDITELRDGLYEQIGKTKVKLVNIDSAVDEDRQRGKRLMEQVAMEQLVQMAYKRRMACRRNNISKAIIRRVSKQVAMGFIERTLARCKAFDATGESCFSEPALQNILFAAPKGTDIGINVVPTSCNGSGTPKQLTTSKPESISLSIPDSCVVDFSGGCFDSADNCFPKLESSSHKSKKRELLLDDVGGVPFNTATTYGRSLHGGTKGKASENTRDNSKTSLRANTMHGNLSVGGFKSEEKPRLKTKQKASATHSLSSSVQQDVNENKSSREMLLSSSFNDSKDTSENCEEAMDFDSIAQNDAVAPVDLNDWFKDLPDGDFGGCLDIPMDDLSMVI